MLDKFNILLIENNKEQIELITQMLIEHFEYATVENVGNGEAATSFFETIKVEQNRKPDIIILSLDLPNQAGLNILTNLKKTEQLKIIPTIALSQKQLSVGILDVYNLHANCFIQRPENDQTMAKAIKTAVNFWHNIVQLPSKSSYYQT